MAEQALTTAIPIAPEVVEEVAAVVARRARPVLAVAGVIAIAGWVVRVLADTGGAILWWGVFSGPLLAGAVGLIYLALRGRSRAEDVRRRARDPDLTWSYDGKWLRARDRVGARDELAIRVRGAAAARLRYVPPARVLPPP